MSKELIGPSKQYDDFLKEIKNRILSARVNTARAVSRDVIKLYWDIGTIIVYRQKKHGWGKGVVEQLAADLTNYFKGVEGYSANNLWRMRNFYLTYKDYPKLAQLVQEIPWGQNITILQMIKDSVEREYYISATAEMGWSRNVLINQIKAGAYQHQKAMPKQHNFPRALPANLAEQADEALKSVYCLDFLDIAKPVLERELERRLVEKVKNFMLELGKGFCFIGNQYRLSLNENDFFIDMLFYNRILKCLVAIELKTGKFEVEHAAKMDFYLDLLNEQVRLADENPSIGIILCVQKDSVIVEYSLRRALNPMGVAEYRLSKRPTKELKAILPSEKDIKNQLLLEMQMETKKDKRG